jgi:hypothetical protein
MRAGALLAVTAATLALAPGAGRCEEEALEAIQRALPAARTRWTVAVPLPSPEAYPIVLEDAIGVHVPYWEVLSLYDLAGRLRSEVHLAEPPASLTASPRGDALLGTTRVGEGRYEHQVIDLQGRLLWSARLPHDLWFSPSGDFLVPIFNELASRQPPAAYRATAGEKAWADEAAASGRWYLAAAANDRLACYQHERLRLIDLANGETLWQQPIEVGHIGGVGDLRISADGRTIVVQNVEGTASGERRVTRVFDGAGTRRWEVARQPVPGQSNGGVLAGVSADGSLVAFDDLDHVSVVRAKDGREIWRLPERGRFRVRAFTDRALVLGWADRLRVLAFDGEGTLSSDRSASLPLQFRLRRADADGGAGEVRALLVRREDKSVKVTEFALGLEEGRSRP